MLSFNSVKKFAVGLSALALAGACLIGCGLTGIVLNPFGGITFVQLFDEPNFTVAMSVDNAVTSTSAVAKVNWVFGDGSGFVEGAPSRTSITYRYNATGTYDVTAYIFDSQGQVEQLNGSVIVEDSNNPVQPPSETELPGQIVGGSPANGATNVPVNTMLTWTSGARATSHDVYLGLDENAVNLANDATAGIFQGGQATTSFDPGGLMPATAYFWRIDEVNSVGITKGTVRGFTTASAPGKAKSPVPQNGSMNARVDQILQWAAGADTTNHSVYFGTDMMAVNDATPTTPDIFKGNQTTLTFDPADETAIIEGELLGSTQYFWRIDENGLGGTTKGDVWAFTTRDPPPLITSANPPDTSVDVAVDVILSWNAPSSVENYDVYLGLDLVDVTLADRNSPEFMGNQAGKNFQPAPLLFDTDYFWRIDTRGPGGTSTGLVLTFKTADVPAQAVLTDPANNALDQDVKPILKWTAGMGGGPLSGFDVYLGTSQSQVIARNAATRVATLGPAATEFEVMTALASNTEHFWTVDAFGPGGSNQGQVFRFRTGVMPGLATMPIPANGLTAVAPDTTLQWTPGANTLEHKVYFGSTENAVNNATTDSAEFRATLPIGTETFNPPAGVSTALAANTQFFWRIDEMGTGGTRKGTVWNFRTGPGKAINPGPNNNATDIEVTRNLTWTAGAGATTHDVYLGTNLVDVTNANTLSVGIFRGNQATTTFDPPGNLAAITQFFWRIDEVASDGTTKTTGDVWNFTTELGKATNPDPTNNATGVALDKILEWTAGAGADTHDVYFGTNLAAVTNATTADPEFAGNQAGTLFDPTSFTAINASTQYFWRIDTVASGGAPVRKGDIWRYTTIAPPAQVSGPSPANGATGVSTSPTLTWASADGAETYDVYFGDNLANVTNATTADTEFQGNQSTRVFSPGMLNAATQYFWRIDSKNAAGTTTGIVFTFTTVP